MSARNQPHPWGTDLVAFRLVGSPEVYATRAESRDAARRRLGIPPGVARRCRRRIGDPVRPGRWAAYECLEHAGQRVVTQALVRLSAEQRHDAVSHAFRLAASGIDTRAAAVAGLRSVGAAAIDLVVEQVELAVRRRMGIARAQDADLADAGPRLIPGRRGLALLSAASAA